MLNRVSTVVASTALITVVTFAFSAILPVGNSTFASKNSGQKELNSSLLFMNNRSDFNVPVITDLSKPNTYFCYFWQSWCY